VEQRQPPPLPPRVAEPQVPPALPPQVPPALPPQVPPALPPQARMPPPPPDEHDLEPSVEARTLPLPGDRTQVRPMPIEMLAARDAEAAASTPPEDPSTLRQREGYFRSVFDEFVAVKQQCGESNDGMEYPRFRVKLVRTRETLMARFQCNDVRFRVYVKEGKAALRAAPVLDPS
jgi:hypothetical protein